MTMATILVRKYSDIKVYKDNIISNLGDLDPNNVPFLDIDSFLFLLGMDVGIHAPSSGANPCVVQPCTEHSETFFYLDHKISRLHQKTSPDSSHRQ
jgi:hypothetical protein